jgi:PPK2 family polyphosphate:nucleotide phosphotransferase
MMLCETQPRTVIPDAIPITINSPVTLEKPSNEPDFFEKFIVEPGTRVKLNEIDPSYKGKYESEAQALPAVSALLQTIDTLHYVMHAEKKNSLLIVLQGMDAGGKDGVVRRIVTGVNPAGCRVIGFKQPTAEELKHDFLWRVHQHVPGKGEVVIFNRSHYEDVLVVRVHQLAPAHVYSKRYDTINNFEQLLMQENDTMVLKFLLHISKEEQLMRFKHRLEDPTRRWKVSESDYKEREYWDDYIKAFEDMLHRTSTRHAPWFVIPSNHKWFRDLAVSQIIMRTLEDLNMKIPAPAVDIARIRNRYHAAELKAKAS